MPSMATKRLTFVEKIILRDLFSENFSKFVYQFLFFLPLPSMPVAILLKGLEVIESEGIVLIAVAPWPASPSLLVFAWVKMTGLPWDREVRFCSYLLRFPP